MTTMATNTQFISEDAQNLKELSGMRINLITMFHKSEMKFTGEENTEKMMLVRDTTMPSMLLASDLYLTFYLFYNFND